MPILVRLALWLLKRYGARIAVATLLYMGFEIGANVVEGVAEQAGRDVARDFAAEARNQQAAPLVRSRPDQSVLEEVAHFLQANKQGQEEAAKPWASPDAEADELVALECDAWRNFDERC